MDADNIEARDLFEVIGTRRSIRYYQTWRPVEDEKIQMILEAARRATHAANAGATGAVVVTRDEIDDSDLSATLPANLQLQLAPVLIFWYGDISAWEQQGEKLKELMKVYALNTTHGWSEKLIDDLIVPFTKAQGDETNWLMTALDAGAAIAQAQLMATRLGLGTCMNQWAGNPGILGLPDTCKVFWIMTLGYPAESMEAGGQRPRRPFADLFHRGKYGTPFPESDAVIDEMRDRKLLQREAPLPWRASEVRALAHMFGLPE